MAIVKTGTVKYAANKSFPDKYNEGAFKQNLVLQMDDNTEETIWFSQGRIPHCTLPKGTAVQLLFEERDGKMTRKLIHESTSGQAQTQAKASSHVLSNAQKKEIADYIQQQGDLLSYCWNTTLTKFEGKIQSEETLRVLATTLYGSAKDKFKF